jgi:hypothetical protein
MLFLICPKFHGGPGCDGGRPWSAGGGAVTAAGKFEMMMFQAAAAAPQPAMPALELPRMFALECLDISPELKISDIEKVFGRDGVNLRDKLLDPLLSAFTTRQALAQALHNASAAR